MEKGKKASLQASLAQLIDEFKTGIEEDVRTGKRVPIKAVTDTDKIRIIYTFLTMEGSKPTKIEFHKLTAVNIPLFGKQFPEIEEFIGKNAPAFEDFVKRYDAFPEKIVYGVWEGSSGRVKLISMKELDFVTICFPEEGKKKAQVTAEFNEAYHKAACELQRKSGKEENKPVNYDTCLKTDECFIDVETQEKNSRYFGVEYIEYCATYTVRDIVMSGSREIKFLNYLAPYVHFTRFYFTNRTDFYGFDDDDWVEDGYENFRNAYYSKEWSWFTGSCETIPGNYDITDIKTDIRKDKIEIKASCRSTQGLNEFELALKKAVSDIRNGSAC